MLSLGSGNTNLPIQLVSRINTWVSITTSPTPDHFERFPRSAFSLGYTGVGFGSIDDKPTPNAYIPKPTRVLSGDGRTDFAVFRSSSATWYLQQSTAGFAGVQFGIATDLPAPADFDGDGKTDIAVFRDGTWFQLRSTQGFVSIPFGTTNDKPVPGAFVP